MVGLLNAGAGDKRTEEKGHMNRGIRQCRNLLGQSQPQCMPTTSFSMSIGTEQAFADSCFVAVVLFFIDEAVGDELIALWAVFAGQRVAMVIQLHCELLKCFQVVKIESHCCYFNGIGLTGLQGVLEGKWWQ